MNNKVKAIIYTLLMVNDYPSESEIYLKDSP